MWGPLETIAYGAQMYLSYDALNRVKKIQLNYSLADGNGTNGTNSTNSTRRLEMEFLT